MEKRPYFVVGDLIANAATGAVAAWATAALVGPGWNMLVGMFAGMALGMLIALVLSFALFVWLFGAMEVMLPAMLSGMLAGMALGMGIPMSTIEASGAIAAGTWIGVAVVVFTYVVDASLRGRVGKWTS